MNTEEFRAKGYEMIDYLVDYLTSLSQRRVTSTLSPGYLRDSLPMSPPKTGESFEKIMEDIENLIMPGLIHWQHPGFHAYFPYRSSFPGTLAVMMKDIIGYAGFNWDYCPAAGELEALMLDWYGKMLGLPNSFLYFDKRSKGSGIMFRSTSECLFISLISARAKYLNRLSHQNPSLSKAALLCTLVAYCTRGSHSRLEKVGLISLVNVKVLNTDKKGKLRSDTLEKAILQDKKNGLVPFFVSIKIGCNVCGESDPVKDMGLICKKHDIWLHVDASYAGNALMCPEYHPLIDGIDLASSFQSNPSHWMLTPLDCAILFVKNRHRIISTVMVDRTKKGYSFEEKDWGYPTYTECRSLKLLFVIKAYGIEGLQKNIRNHVDLATLFATYIKQDDRFECLRNHFGFVCFRLKGPDVLNSFLKDSINDSGKLYLTPTNVDRKYAIRFFVCSENASEDDIKFSFEVICEHAEKALRQKVSRLEQRSLSNPLYDEFYRYALP